MNSLRVGRNLHGWQDPNHFALPQFKPCYVHTASPQPQKQPTKKTQHEKGGLGKE